jgi:xanthine dehydrogenase large subunit
MTDAAIPATAVHQGTSHESADGHVSGCARYTGDITPLVGQLHAWPVLSPHAHAVLLVLDISQAVHSPGVAAVLTAADVPGENDTGAIIHDEVLMPAIGAEVQYHRQAVAWVLAETSEQARIAAGLVYAEYQQLPAILDIATAIAQNSFQGNILRAERGDVGAAAVHCPHQLRGELYVGAQDHFYLETQHALAMPDDDGGLLVHSSTQHPSETQAIVARVLGIPRHRVTVQCLRMGGGFGGKESQANPYAAIAALGVHVTKRPVAVRLTRHLDMQLTGKRHPFLGRYHVGFGDDGELHYVDLELFSDGGWSLDLSEAVLSRAVVHADNAYFIPNMRVVGRVCRTHKTSQTAFRGFGGPQGMLVIEEIMAQVALHLGLPPHQVRQRNFYQHGHDTHYGQHLPRSLMPELWERLLHTSQFIERSRDIERWNQEHPQHKRGLAITPVKFGISFNTIFLNQAGALVHIYEDGSVQVNHGGTEMGQGLHSKVRQVAADALGLGLEMVRVTATRTDKVPNTSATAASSGTDLNAAAVQNACIILRERLATVAAQLLSQHLMQVVHPNDVRFAQGQVYSIARPDVAVTFQQVVHAAYLARVSLSTTGFYRTEGLHFDKLKGWGRPFKYFAWGASVTEVLIDGFTGRTTIERIDVLHDCGNSINPLIDRGQVIGGFVQGLGWLTSEEVVWDSAGVLRTFAPSTYKIPTILDIPEAFYVELFRSEHEPGAIFGSKAVGEPPLMLAISVREAIRAAVAGFGKPTTVELPSPATPEAVFWAIEAVRNRH